MDDRVCACDWCEGTGRDGDDKCGSCNGTGKKRPRCAVCGEPALDGKATCGEWRCAREHSRELEQRRRRAVFGAKLEPRNEGMSGWRHYLQGEPIHCGTGLELYADDPLNPDAYIRGHYEANLSPSEREPVVWLCTNIGDMRVNLHLAHFRWPGRSSHTMRKPSTCNVCGHEGPGIGPDKRCPRLGCAGAIR